MVFARGHSGFSFEECAECCLTWEIKFLSYLIYQHVFVFQQYFGLNQSGAVDPVHHAPAACFCYQAGKVMWGKCQLLGVKRYGPVAGAMLVDKFLEFAEQQFLTRFLLLQG